MVWEVKSKNAKSLGFQDTAMGKILTPWWSNFSRKCFSIPPSWPMGPNMPPSSQKFQARCLVNFQAMATNIKDAEFGAMRVFGPKKGLFWLHLHHKHTQTGKAGKNGQKWEFWKKVSLFWPLGSFWGFFGGRGWATGCMCAF